VIKALIELQKRLDLVVIMAIVMMMNRQRWWVSVRIQMEWREDMKEGDCRRLWNLRRRCNLGKDRYWQMEFKVNGWYLYNSRRTTERQQWVGEEV
jgi:hypothetical protein